jgi:hypothetical protein
VHLVHTKEVSDGPSVITDGTTGVCSMCGKKILDTRAYKQSAT